MPIYEYRCASCGYAKDCIQKLSDPPLTVCPECGKDTFSKQLSAPGFQLKGSGWYATDFKAKAPAGKAEEKPAAKTEESKSEAKPAASKEEAA